MSFPTFPGFSGGVFARSANKALSLECVRAWNDFHLDEWCASAPDRLISQGMLPVWDVEESVKEVQRLAGKGCRAITFPDSPVPLRLPSFHTDHWDRLWAVCEETDIPLSLHFGSGSFVPGFSANGKFSNIENAPFAVAIAIFGTNSMWTMTDLLFSGALQRHPGLKFLLAEGGIGWIPYMLERIDYTWERHRWYQDIDKLTRPSDLFRRHFWGCFIDDFHGIRNRDEIGVDRILVEVDYPHSDSNWPNSRKRIAENLADVPDDQARQIVETNARQLLKFPRTETAQMADHPGSRES
jgi:predicted TIM-barrel fold metal-dependent hydrolase